MHFYSGLPMHFLSDVDRFRRFNENGLIRNVHELLLGRANLL
jgi:hypothetical protein